MTDDLLIVPSSNAGDSRIFVVEGDQLRVPANLAEFLRQRNIVTATALLAFFRAFPEPLQKRFGWDTKTLRSVLVRLLRTVRPNIPTHALVKRQPVQRTFGATAPPKDNAR